MMRSFISRRVLVLLALSLPAASVGCVGDNSDAGPTPDDPATPAAPEPGARESALDLRVSDSGELESVTTPAGETLESLNLESNLESVGAPESVLPVRVLGGGVSVGTRVGYGLVPGCINRQAPYVAVTLWVRSVAVANVYIPGYSNGGNLCVGVYESRTRLCGGPWCVNLTTARDAIKSSVEQLFSRHVGAAMGASLSRVLAPQVVRRLAGLRTQ